jgi:FkbM family methyltransferase
MKIQEGLLSVWQRAPLSWRTGFVKSRFAPPVRRIMNSLFPAGARVFQLAAPLEGYRMLLEWRSSKAYVFGTHEREVVDVLLLTIRPGWTVFDLGAHVGYFALLLAKLVGPKGRVVAFEPFPENFQTLEENVQLNAARNIVLERSAVSAVSGMASLKSSDSDRLTSTASLVHGQPASEVKVVSLDDYAARQPERIHFVMMDVEGAEADVLTGMRSILRRDLPVLLIELHGFDSTGQSHPALQELRAMNYSFRYLDAPGAQVHILAQPPNAATDDKKALD